MQTGVMRQKIRDKSGAALLLIVLGIAIIIMAGIILVPVLNDANESAKLKLDEDFEQTAWDSAIMKFFSDGEFSAVYDSENKLFVENLNGRYISGYGQSSLHKDQVIEVDVDSEGNVKITWIDPRDFRAQR